MTSPLDLLKFDETRKRPWLNDKWGFILGGSMGFGLGCWVNFMRSRPILSGLQRHIGFSLIGATACFFVDRYRDKYMSERDAVLRHYIELHPEDFPTPERKKYGELMDRWIPIR
ncbi:NADH dehydrogenase [ubiquinone] 1 subunit C2 [Phlebotomus argentipes]|uniref:NADH dehydrogenase [ubiquinone] 1 subunit C2 n=1 Tax=Phlebotomus argentipes TaxID=94469 RepID=UPI002892E78E|nr:NADH dehydrogenase [ubiquinone] 1 subunit C2 [Phlebotomus argentipes]